MQNCCNRRANLHSSDVRNNMENIGINIFQQWQTLVCHMKLAFKPSQFNTYRSQHFYNQINVTTLQATKGKIALAAERGQAHAQNITKNC